MGGDAFEQRFEAERQAVAAKAREPERSKEYASHGRPLSF
jgi:hypothetical protein